MSHNEVARELKTVLDSLDSHDPDFTVPMLRAVLVRCHDYFNGCLKLSTLVWHMKRFRNEAMNHDAQEAGETR